MHGREERALPDSLDVTWGGGSPPWISTVDVILIAVGDQDIRHTAQLLADSDLVQSRQTVLHLSGLLDLSALEPLRRSGCALGSLHPLQALPDPVTAPAQLAGAWAAVDGDDSAVAIARELAGALGLSCLSIPSDGRPCYHAAAVFASNYVVVLAAVARGLMERAGLSREAAWEALKPLLTGAVQNLVASDPEFALTGPVVRADGGTLRKHLAAMSVQEAELYRILARAAIPLAGLGPAEQSALERELELGLDAQ
jgi:predicted short-subunit dehydrogenase-like oxidoreductase (DUF2520 family)